MGIITACTNSKRAEQEREDSLRAADSIARVEALEAARLDSIRQDSIRQDSIARQQEKLQQAMPTVQLFGKDLQDMGGGTLTDVNVLRKKLVGYSKKYRFNIFGSGTFFIFQFPLLYNSFCRSWF